MTRHHNCSIRTRRHTPYRTPSVHSGAGLPGIDHHTNSSLSEREREQERTSARAREQHTGERTPARTRQQGLKRTPRLKGCRLALLRTQPIDRPSPPFQIQAGGRLSTNTNPASDRCAGRRSPPTPFPSPVTRARTHKRSCARATHRRTTVPPASTRH